MRKTLSVLLMLLLTAAVARAQTSSADSAFTKGTSETGENRKVVRVENTQAYLTPPPGFTKASEFDGFEQKRTGASIMVKELDSAFSELADSFSDVQQLRARGMDLLSTEELTVMGNDGLLMSVRQQVGPRDFLKWILVLGNEEKSLWAMATVSEQYREELWGALRECLLDLRWPYPETFIPGRGVPFDLTPQGGLEKVGSLETMHEGLVYTVGGKFPVESIDEPLLVTSYEMSENGVRNQREQVLDILSGIPFVTNLQAPEIRTITISDLNGYEIVTAGNDLESGKPVIVYQVVLFRSPYSFVIQGIVGRDAGEKYLPVFRRMARTFEVTKYLSPDGVSVGRQFYALRQGLGNSWFRFVNEKKGRVAFLGGSSTELGAWREDVCKQLKEKFPEVEFDFVNAGKDGTNSTYGALRLEHDVFGEKPVDLLFIDFSQADSMKFAPHQNQPMRAMEGIVRHARKLNPNIDIVVLHLADKAMAKEISETGTAKTVGSHERIASYYRLPSINLAERLSTLLESGKLDWDELPSDRYVPTRTADAKCAEWIMEFLNDAWSGEAPDKAQEYKLPEPMDPQNYENGRMIAIDTAQPGEGWKVEKDWKTTQPKLGFDGSFSVLSSSTADSVAKVEFEGTLFGLHAVAGPDAAAVVCSVDGGVPVVVDLYDAMAPRAYHPIYRVVEDDLKPGKHVVELRMSQKNSLNPNGKSVRIIDFLAN